MFPNFDPSKMDPKVLMELSNLVRQLPPEKISRMQSLMHNMMAGFDVKAEMEEFEKTLPAGFREKLVSIMASSGMAPPAGASPFAGSKISPIGESQTVEAEVVDKNMDMREARLTVLRAVADGSMSPDDAERVLFKD